MDWEDDGGEEGGGRRRNEGVSTQLRLHTTGEDKRIEVARI